MEGFGFLAGFEGLAAPKGLEGFEGSKVLDDLDLKQFSIL